MRDTRLLSRLPDTSRHFVDDDVVVCCVPAQQAAQADDGVVLPRLREASGGGRNFKGTRHTNDLDVSYLCARTQEPIHRSLKQSFGDESVKPRNHDSKTSAGSV